MSKFDYNPRHRGALTAGELTVLQQVAHGESRKAIARALTMKYNTVSQHLHNATHKLGAQSVEHAVYLAVKRQLIP